MATKSKVNIKYRTPYIPRKEIPNDEVKQMKKEISYMRQNLLKKQKRLEKSEQFTSDERLTNELKGLKVKELNTNKKIWNEWNRLYSLEESNLTSITGKRKIRQNQIESLREHGYTWINNSNLDKFGDFMDYVKENYSMKAIGSDTVATYFFEHGATENEDMLQKGFDKYMQSN